MAKAKTFSIRPIARGLFAVEGIFGGVELDYFDSSPLYRKVKKRDEDTTERQVRPVDSKGNDQS